MAPSFTSLGTPPIRPIEPFPAFDDKIIKTMEKAICEAWNQLRHSARIDLSTASETAITKELQESIIDVMNNGSVAGFCSELFNQPSRDASVTDYSGKYIEKKPDLTLYLSKPLPLSVNKGVFFECKPIGNIANYLGENGLERFCDGRYAWAMPHAGMIGYVQRQTPPFTAKEAIEANVKSGKLTLDNHYEDTSATYHPIFVSVHSRHFYLLNGNPPGPIAIRHLWLTQ